MLNLKTAAAGLGLLLLCAACSKSPRNTPKPAYSHRSLNNVEVRYLKPFSLDMDGDGTEEVFFVVGLINDLTGAHAKFAAVSVKTAKLLSKPDSIARLNEGDAVPVLPDHPLEWNGFDTYLCEMLLPKLNPADTTWLGAWVAADKKFMGVQFRKGNDTYLGWISASVDTARDCMILHDCAWRHLDGGAVKAGRRQD